MPGEPPKTKAVSWLNSSFKGMETEQTTINKLQVSSVLMELEGLLVRSDSACASALSQVTQQAVTDDMVCAGGEEGKEVLRQRLCQHHH